MRAEAAIAARGAVPVRLPLITAVPPRDPAALDAAVARWAAGHYDWLVVTSAAGASAIAGAGARAGVGRGIAAVGPATAAALAAHGLTAALTPTSEFTGAALGAELVERLATATPSARVLLAVAAAAGDDVERALRDAGHRVDRVTAYRTVPAPRDPAGEREVAAHGVAAVLVTSGSVARELAARFDAGPAGALTVAIGPPSAAVLVELGRPADVVASHHTIPGMLDALAAHLTAHPQTTPPRTTGDHA